MSIRLFLVTAAAAIAVLSMPAQQAAASRDPDRADVRYGPHDRNTLDFWQAEGEGVGPRPLLVFIHGGGWINGDKQGARRACEPYLAAGIHCAAINYRRTDTEPLPAPVHDAARAIQFLRSKATEWQIDSPRIAVTGGSAGACTSMWLLLHDDLRDPEATDPVLRESTRVCAAATSAGQTSIDPPVIEAWLGPKVLEHAMIWRAVGEPDMATALAHYDRHRELYHEFSPINHLTADDPPLFMSYGKDVTLPSKDAGHGIHHPHYGIAMHEAALAIGHECHLVIPGTSKSERYTNAREFLLDKLRQDPEQALAERAKTVHDRILTLDTHKDIDSRLAPELDPENLPSDPATREEFRRRYDPTVRGSQQVDFPKMREGGYDCAFFIVYVGQGALTPAGYHKALADANAKFDAIHRMVRLHGDTIGLATTADEVEQLHRDGKLIACIGIENGYPMGEDLGLIAKFRARGARYMSIAHNRHSQLGDSHTPDEPLHHGLSDLGRQAIAEMNRVGIMVDVSHASKAAMMQAVALSKAPVIASHSGCRAVNDHSRNLDDEQLRALSAQGGVIQVVALGSFLKSDAARDAAVRALRSELGIGRGRSSDAPAPTEDLDTRMQRYAEAMKTIDAEYPPASVKDFVDHIDHAVRIAGIDHVGIGSDFDGGGGIAGWQNASESRNVTIELLRRGYSAPQIEKIWGQNLLRVMRECERIAGTGK